MSSQDLDSTGNITEGKEPVDQETLEIRARTQGKLGAIESCSLDYDWVKMNGGWRCSCEEIS